MKKVLYLFLVLFVSQAYSYESKYLKMPPPAGWNENPKVFGAEVIFMSPIVYKKTPLMLILNTLELSLAGKNIQKFIDEDIRKEFKSNFYKPLGKGEIQLKGGRLVFIEGRILEDEIEQGIFVGVIERPAVYHHFMFQAPLESFKESLPSIKASLSLLQLRTGNN